MVDVAIAGAGSVGFSSACLLRQLGNTVTMWSPSGRGTRDIRDGTPISTSGGLNGSFAAGVVEDPRDLCAAAKLLLVAVPAYGQRSVFSQLLPHLTDEHVVVVMGGQMSFGALYLSKLLADAGRRTIVALTQGPITMGRKLSGTEVVQVPPKTKVRIAALPAAATPRAVAAMQDAFGARFEAHANTLDVAFTALGGIVHSGLVLGNITRIEEGEEWCGYYYVTEAVSRLIMALDADRMTVAAAYGIHTPTAVELFSRPDRKGKTVRDVLFPLTYERTFRNGPRKISTRYIEEEIPYYLVSLEAMAGSAGTTVPTISKVVDLFEIMCAKTYRGVNGMAIELGVPDLSVAQMLQLTTNGYGDPSGL